MKGDHRGAAVAVGAPHRIQSAGKDQRREITEINRERQSRLLTLSRHLRISLCYWEVFQAPFPRPRLLPDGPACCRISIEGALYPTDRRLSHLPLYRSGLTCYPAEYAGLGRWFPVTRMKKEMERDCYAVRVG